MSRPPLRHTRRDADVETVEGAGGIRHLRAFLIAGEPSGDRLGGALMHHLAEELPGVTFDGVGGPEMARAGLASRFDMSELSVMGLTEVLPRYPALRRRVAECAEAVVGTRPDVLITIDSPDFCLRVASKVRARAPGVRILHYVAPSVWAWRAGRALRMARSVDQVLALLPFEPPYMEAVGLRCDFVGHPVISSPRATPDAAAAFHARVGAGEGPLVLVLPGSRRSEVTRLAPVFGAALRRLADVHPGLRVVLPVAAAELMGPLRDAIGGWPGAPVLLDPDAEADRRAAFAAADVALAASGTVSLELAAARTPMVIAYDMAWLSWKVMSWMVRLDTITLVNLVTETQAIPEFLGPDCRADKIADGLLHLLADADARAAQRRAMADAMTALGEGGPPPGQRAARAVIDGLSG